MSHFIHWKLVLSLGVALALTIIPVTLQGRFAIFGEQSRELNAAASSLEHFPGHFGSWDQFETADPLSGSVVQELGLAGYRGCYYRHRDTGDVILLLLMVGRPGPLVRHPPDICFANRANVLLNESEIITEGNDEQGTSRLRTLTYRPRSQLEQPFRVAYGFSTDMIWDVPEWPRVEYGAHPYLYKVHIQAVEPEKGFGSPVESPLEDFVRAFTSAFAQFRSLKPIGPT